LYNPNNFRGDGENLFGNLLSVNVLCVPRESTTTVDLREILSPEDDWRKPPAA
jgi:hypothetical protein